MSGTTRFSRGGKVLAVLLMFAGAAGTSWPERQDPETGPGGKADGAGRFSYHLRVVRISGASAARGAGYGCARFCGTPIVVPDEEAWGTPSQLQALAKLLGGDKAEAVTGFIVSPDREGESRFEGTIYPGETWAELRFSALAPAERDGSHELKLELESPGGREAPLAEAHLLARSGRTVAIAAPSPLQGEWIVVAVTPMDPDAAAERIAEVERIETLTMSPGMAPPERVRVVQPIFPEAARQQRRSGRIVMQAVIDTGGVPRAVKVLRVPPACEDLAAASVEAVQQWRYEPAKLDGRPIPVYFTIQVEFVLE